MPQMLSKFTVLLVNFLQFITAISNISSWYYNSNNFINTEPIGLKIHGQIPSYLTGKLIGIGPSHLSATSPVSEVTNIYDTLGVLSFWNLNGEDNIGSYQSVFIQSVVYNNSQSTQKNEKEELPTFFTQQETIATTTSKKPTSPSAASSSQQQQQQSYPQFSNDNTNLNLFYQKESNNLLLFNHFLTINKVNLNDATTTFPFSSFTHNDDLNQQIDPTLSEQDLNDFALTSSDPGEYLEPLTSDSYLINYLILPLENSTSSILYLFAMRNDNGSRKVLGYTVLPYLPGYLPSLMVIDDYVFISVHPIELDLSLLYSTNCFTCSLISHINTLPTHLFIFSLLTLSKYHIFEDIDYFPLKHIEIPPTTPTSTSSSSPFLVTQIINGWLDFIQVDDYPNDEILTVDLCLLTDLNRIDMRLNHFIPGNLENIKKYSEEEMIQQSCDEIRRIEIDIPSRLLPRHVYLSINSDFSLEPTDTLLSSTKLLITDSNYEEMKLHSIVVNSLYQNDYYCYIYGLTSSPSSSSASSSTSSLSELLPNRLVKINICQDEEQKDVLMSSTEEEFHSQKISTLVSSYEDKTVYFGQPIYIPKPLVSRDLDPVIENELNSDDSGQVLVREGDEDEGCLILPTKSIHDGRVMLNILNPQTMTVLAVIESPWELSFSWKEIFVSQDQINYKNSIN